MEEDELKDKPQMVKYLIINMLIPTAFLIRILLTFCLEFLSHSDQQNLKVESAYHTFILQY